MKNKQQQTEPVLEPLALLHAKAKEAWEHVMCAFYIIGGEGEDVLGDYENIIAEMPEGELKEKVIEELENLEIGYEGLDEYKDYIGRSFQPELYGFQESLNF